MLQNRFIRKITKGNILQGYSPLHLCIIIQLIFMCRSLRLSMLFHKSIRLRDHIIVLTILSFFYGNGILYILCLGSLIHHRKNTLCTGKCRKNRINLHGNLIDRAGKLSGIIDKYSKPANIKSTQHAQNTTNGCC